MFKTLPFVVSLFFVLCVSLSGNAQNKALIDSLEHRAQTATVDSVKVSFLNKCAAYYMRYDIAKMPEKLRQAEALVTDYSSNWSDSSSFLRHRAWVLLLYGNFNLRQTNNPEAIRYYQQALSLYEKTKFYRGVGDCYNGLGSVYYMVNDLDKAAYYYSLAAPAFERAGNLEGSMVVYGNVSAILGNKGDYKGALREIKKAEQIINEKKLSKYEGGIYADMTRFYVRLDSAEKARIYAEKARLAFERSKDLVEYSNHLHTIASIYLEDNKLDDAETYTQQALETSIKANNKSLIASNCVLYQDLYLRRAKAALSPALKDSFFLKAFEYNARERAYRDSLFNTEKSGQIAELQIKYETEKKEREISKLSEAAKNQELESLRREVQLRQEKIKSEQARQQALLLERNNADYALQLAIQDSKIKEQNAESREKEREIQALNSEKERSDLDAIRERQLRYGLLTGLAGLALIAFLLLRLYWLKSNSNKKIRLQQAEIEAKNENLAQANRFKNIFLSNMSHEIRTPLNTIIGMSGLLADTQLDPRQREYATIVNQASENLLNLINEILDFSKIEAGKIEFQQKPFDVRELLQRQVNLLRFAAEQKGISLQLSIAPDLPRMILGDAARLGQILLNLLGNAIKFTEKGSVSLRAETGKDNSGSFLRFEVQDTGIGISAEDLPNIFNAFQQAGEDTHLRHSGTGLGLSITKQLVELQGGKIWAESAIGEGSAMRFTIPLVLADEKATLEGDIIPETLEKLPPCRILLVEDNAFNQLLATELFQKIMEAPYVVIAENGVEAIEKAGKEAFDLIFMDIKMPLLDGFAATRALRESGLQTPILALTANATSDEQEKCLQAGMNDYLSKPISLVLLYRAIQHWAGF